MTDDEEEYRPSWYPYDGGLTIGASGPEGGVTLRDEEFGDPEDDEDSDARLTLEQGRASDPGFSLTATLYGWIFHTHRAIDEADALVKYDAMKSELTRLAGMLPYEESWDIPGRVRDLSKEIATFEQQYP